MLKRNICIVILMTSLCLLSLNPGSKAQLNPDFVKWQANADRFNLIAPPPIKIKSITSIDLPKNNYPAYFNLLDQNLLTSVKEQGSAGSCWCFGSFASLESVALKLNLGEYDLSENNIYYGHQFYKEKSGGSFNIVTAYLLRGAGPVLESQDPYQDDEGEYHPIYNRALDVSNVIYLPTNDNDLIKYCIYNYGAVATSFYWNSVFYTPDQYFYYCSEDMFSANHIVSIVGWNDDIELYGQKGAWIIKNSWSSDWGDHGYFYIAYNSFSINRDLAIWTDVSKHNNKKNILQYDSLGVLSAWGWNNGNDYGLIRFNLKNDSKLDAIGTYTQTANTTIQFSVYKYFDGNILSEKLYDSPNYNCSFPGYYKFSINKSVSFDSDQDIFVKVMYDDPEKSTPIPIECPIEEYAIPIITYDNCWASDTGQNNTWIAWGDYTDYFQNINIKGYSSLKNMPNSVKYTILNAYPNPSNQGNDISFELPAYSYTSLKIYNSKGQLVKTLINENRLPGKNSINWNGKNNNNESVASGIYLLKLQNDFVQANRKIILIK